MKLGKKYSNMTVLMAMIQGVIIGVFGIIIVGIILLSTEGKQPMQDAETEIPTGGPVEKNEQQEQEIPKEEKLALFSKQHGVFENNTAAETFLKEDSSLTKAAIIEHDKQYFVWSAVSSSETDLEAMLQTDTFKKAFQIERKACSLVATQLIWDILQAEDIEKIKKYEEDIQKIDNKNEQEKMKALLAFTDDVAVIKLHLLQYINEEACVKISF